MAEIKLPPNNNEAEESVIGSLLINGDAIDLVKNIIKPNDFYFENNQDMFKACLDLRERRESINQVTLAQELKRTGKLEKIGGVAILNYLISIIPTALDIEYYANIVYRLSVSRSLISLGDKISAIGYLEEPEVNDTINKVCSIVTDFRKSAIVYNELVSPTNAADIVLDMANEEDNIEKSIKYGFRDLDEITGGIFPELIIIGARPSVGKSQLMLDIMENIAMQGKKVLFCSAEMSVKSLMERKIARELQIDIRTIRNSNLRKEYKDKLIELSGEISQSQIYYLPQGASSTDIYNEAIKLHDNIGLDIVFVDYLQILKDCWQGGRENKTVLVGRASKQLKTIVNDLNIPVICASQLSRDIEHRSEDSKRPVLSDLRESGDIEQDSDIVFLLWRDMYNQSNHNVLEIKMAKNRQLGDAPMKQLIWLPEKHRYVDAVNEM